MEPAVKASVQSDQLEVTVHKPNSHLTGLPPGMRQCAACEAISVHAHTLNAAYNIGSRCHHEG